MKRTAVQKSAFFLLVLLGHYGVDFAATLNTCRVLPNLDNNIVCATVSTTADQYVKGQFLDVTYVLENVSGRIDSPPAVTIPPDSLVWTIFGLRGNQGLTFDSVVNLENVAFDMGPPGTLTVNVPFASEDMASATIRYVVDLDNPQPNSINNILSLNLPPAALQLRLNALPIAQECEAAACRFTQDWQDGFVNINVRDLECIITSTQFPVELTLGPGPFHGVTTDPDGLSFTYTVTEADFPPLPDLSATDTIGYTITQSDASSSSEIIVTVFANPVATTTTVSTVANTPVEIEVEPLVERKAEGVNLFVEVQTTTDTLGDVTVMGNDTPTPVIVYNPSNAGFDERRSFTGLFNYRVGIAYQGLAPGERCFSQFVQITVDVECGQVPTQQFVQLYEQVYGNLCGDEVITT